MVESTAQRTSEDLLGIPYNRERGPWVFNDSTIDIFKEGINCQTFTHLYYRTEFGIELPIGMWSKEIMEDEEHFFRSVTSDGGYLKGDIFLFGRRQTLPQNLHVAVLHTVGQTPESHILLHANQEDGQVSAWLMKRFNEHPRYPVVRRVKRIVPDLFSITVQPCV